MKQWQRYAAELLGTFTLVFGGIAALSSGGPGFAAFGFGLALLAGLYAFGEISGGHFNPARTLGPDLVGNKWTGFWIYIVAPPLGAILGWIVHTVAVKGDTNLRDDFVRVKGDLTGGVGGPSQPPA